MFSVYLPLKMTTCAAKGCYNSSRKKVKMNCKIFVFYCDEE